jgi:heme oxygenase
MARDTEGKYDLLIEMRKATRRSHNIANALILSKLVVVLTDKGLYARALSSFLPVYSKLEALLQQHRDVPGLSTVVAVTSTIPARTSAMEQVTTTGLLAHAAVR